MHKREDMKLNLKNWKTFQENNRVLKAFSIASLYVNNLFLKNNKYPRS